MADIPEKDNNCKWRHSLGQDFKPNANSHIFRETTVSTKLTRTDISSPIQNVDCKAVCEEIREFYQSNKIEALPSSENWYLTMTLEKGRHSFLMFVKQEAEREEHLCTAGFSSHSESFLYRYINTFQLTELHLDNVLRDRSSSLESIPREIFRCHSVRCLSLRYNDLEVLPADIGNLYNLIYLALTGNKLENRSIPYTLCFCRQLEILLLDNNLLDALPGFLLDLKSLKTVHRHGNHNYFKSTFMWYHTDVYERIIAIPAVRRSENAEQPLRLQFWAAKAVIAKKVNFFRNPCVPKKLKDYMCEIYSYFNLCAHCETAKLLGGKGYKVITFKNPYLGNTCVPFQHWACSLYCAAAIEVPARYEQMISAQEQDRLYDSYIRETQVRWGCPVGPEREEGRSCTIL